MTAESKRASRRQTLLRVAGTLIALGLLGYLLAEQGWNEFLGALAQIPLQTFLLAIGLSIVSRIAVVSRWYFLLRAAKVDVSWYRAAMLTFSGLFASNFLPTTVGGDVIRIAGVGQVEDRRTAYVTSVFADRIVGMLGMAMALPFGVGPLWAYFQGGAGVPMLPLAGAIVGVGPWARLRQRLRNVAEAVFESLQLWKQSPLGLLAAFVCTWTIMFCLFGNIWLFLQAMGEQIGFGLVAGLWSFTYFITLIPISINGLGLQEVSMTFIYVTLGGLATDNVLAVAVLVRALATLVSLPGVLFLAETLSWGRPQKTPVKDRV